MADFATGVLGEVRASHGKTAGVFGINHSNGERAFGVAGVVDGKALSIGVSGDNRSDRGIGVLGISRGGTTTDDGETIDHKGVAATAAAKTDMPWPLRWAPS